VRFSRVAQEVKERRFVAKIEKLGMKDGVVSFAYNPRLQNRVPAEAVAAIDAARQHIIDGTLVVPTAEF
jgi:basic membrane lipoprotein Med (substrate-binding protein (PBP1-ABC) superfamily)